MTTKADQPVYSVFLFNGPFNDESSPCISLEKVRREEIGALISLAERQKAMDIVIRYHAGEAGE